MKTAFVFTTALLAIGCGKDQNACEELAEEMCACLEVEECDTSSAADATDEQIDACQVMLDAGDVCGGEFDTGM